MYEKGRETVDCKLRVLHVVVNMNRGGAETLLMNLYRNIDRSKVQFDFLTCKEGVFDSEIKELGGKVYRIPYVTEVGHCLYLKQLYLFFQQHHTYQIVHAHLDKMSGFVLQTAKKAKIPIRIAHSHNTRSEGGLVARTYKWYAGTRIVPSATHLYACSKAAASWLFQKHDRKVILLNNGVDVDRFRYCQQARQKARAEWGVNERTLVWGHVGRFNHQKNHRFLLELFHKVHQKNQNTVLVLVGEGVLKSEIEKQIKELELAQSVRLLGVRSDVHEILQGFDCFVFPSVHEGLPLTLIEAQACGLPCIISDDISEEVDMECGLIQRLSLDKAKEWERVLSFIDPSLPRKEVAYLLDRKGYNIKHQAEKIEQFYRVCMKEGHDENHNHFYANI